MRSSIYTHPEPGDKFEVNVCSEQTSPYVTLKLEGKNIGEICIFTPSGLGWATDYLTELRDAINGAIEELGQIEKNLAMPLPDPIDQATPQDKADGDEEAE